MRSVAAASVADTTRAMRELMLATSPGVVVLGWFFGWGTIVNIVLASGLAVVLEACALRVRGQLVAPALRDSSALVTGVLLGIALPPMAPWWLVLIAVAGAIVVAKHLYGGLGHNVFNPAMVGYAIVLIAFPLEMSTWLDPRASAFSLQETIARVVSAEPIPDAFTAATSLDVMKFRGMLTTDEVMRQVAFGMLGGYAWEWINAAFLAGGLYLLARRFFTWHAPVAMLSAMCVLSLAFYDGASSSSGGAPLFHLFSGATMLGAFFIVTDPVTSPATNRGRLLFGAGSGALIYLIRVFGDYPDAVAFAVLIMNMATPVIDSVVKPPIPAARGRPA